MSLPRYLTTALLVFSFAAAVRAEPLLVSAAASLTDALREITATYQRSTTGASVTFNFGGSGTLQRQIENGAPVDVFIAAAAAPMDSLEKQNLLLPKTRTDLLTSVLVLVTPKERADIVGFADLAADKVKHIAIGEPRTVPAGVYAVECLTAQKLLPRLEGKLVRLLDVRQVLATVETGNADAGLVYRADALGSTRVRVVATAPAGSHRPITYPVAIMRRTKNAEAAQKYVDFLKSETAHEIFEKHGFTVAPAGR